MATMQVTPRSAIFLGLGLVLLASCGDDTATTDGDSDDMPGDVDADGSSDAIDAPPLDADTRDLLERLNGLTGVTATERTCQVTQNARCFDLTFEQPADHDAPAGLTFAQHATLLHRDLAVPTIAYTTGYDDYFGDYPDELAQALRGNQISIEHRFFGVSRPSPADWTKLTIRQAAADEHRIITTLKTIYPGAWLTNGASKGGMTAAYHRRFWPDDVDGTVPYVAPLSLAAGDGRYATFLETVGTTTCRTAVRNVIVELLSTARFNAMLARAQAEADTDGLAYTRIAIGPAVESAITGIEWAFWSYFGLGQCNRVPAVTASDATMWTFLNAVSAPSGSTDDQVARFEAYYYQAAFELGFPDSGGDYTIGLTRYNDDEFAGGYPVGVEYPVYSPAAMQDIDAWVQSEGHRLLFFYGETDPWTAGRFTLGNATDSASFLAPRGTHGSGLHDLAPADRAAAVAKLAAWTGVTPSLRTAERGVPLAAPQVRKLPPAIVRGLQLQQQRRAPAH